MQYLSAGLLNAGWCCWEVDGAFGGKPQMYTTLMREDNLLLLRKRIGF